MMRFREVGRSYKWARHFWQILNYKVIINPARVNGVKLFLKEHGYFLNSDVFSKDQLIKA